MAVIEAFNSGSFIPFGSYNALSHSAHSHPLHRFGCAATAHRRHGNLFSFKKHSVISWTWTIREITSEAEEEKYDDWYR